MQGDLLFAKTALLFLLPPGINLLLMLIGVLLSERWRLIGICIFWVGLVSLYMLSTPFVAEGMMMRWQEASSLKMPLIPVDEKETAIVVLGGGRNDSAPEFNDIDTVNGMTLERLRYAARLQKQTHLPVLLSGGKTFNEPTPEAVLMNETFITDFHATPTWLESRSRDTVENGEFSASLLQSKGIKKIYLVTHAWHMPRAILAFRHAELEIVPAPMGYILPSSGHPGALLFVPSAQSLTHSSWIIHERLALWWLWLKS